MLVGLEREAQIGLKPNTAVEDCPIGRSVDFWASSSRRHAQYLVYLMCGDYLFDTKFRDPKFMGIADFHYLIAPKGLVARSSLPPQWGLLDETPAVSLPALRKEVRKNTGIVSNFLRAIARSNTTSMMHSQGMAFRRGEFGIWR